MGGEGVGVYGCEWHDPGIRGGVLLVGSFYVCGKCRGVWMGLVGACGGGAGGVFVGICEYSHPLVWKGAIVLSQAAGMKRS